MSDGRPYPWLSQQQEGSWTEARYLIYQPFGGLCNQLACLECAVALARATGRTLVLPRWRAQYGQPWLSEGSDYFDLSPLSRIVRCATLDQFAAARAGSGDGEGVALVRLHLCFNPAWADARGWELFPELRSLLANLEYLREVDAAAGLRLGIAAGSGVEDERSLELPQPLRGTREVAAAFGDAAQSVLALDHSFCAAALPSLLDAGERALLLQALRPSPRIRAKAEGCLAAARRPCLAAHVRRTDLQRLAELTGDARLWPAIGSIASQIGALLEDRQLASWLLSTDATDAAELAALSSLPRRAEVAESAREGEDAVAAALVDVWACVGADFFVGAPGHAHRPPGIHTRLVDTCLARGGVGSPCE